MRSADYPLLPSGVHDHLPEAAARVRAVQEALIGEFSRWGYRRIITPLYEYLDVLERGVGLGRRQQIFKFVEPRSGQVVALRPDITPQVARLYATRYAGVEGAVRFCYEGRVVRFEAGASAGGGARRDGDGPREVFQAGVELLGRGGPEADAEVVALLIASLEATGLSDFQIDLGQVEITRAVLAHSGIEDELRERVVDHISRKDRTGLETALVEASVPEAARRSLLSLTSLYGGSEVLEEAARVIVAPGAREALEELGEVVRLLGEEGHGERLTIDLGELRDFDYHDGTHFHAYVGGLGVPIAGGGRYDHLAERYGQEARATGFAVDVEHLLTVLDRVQPAPPAPDCPGVLLVGGRSESVDAARTLRQDGCLVARAFGEEEVRSAPRLGFQYLIHLEGEAVQVVRLADGASRRLALTEVAAAIRQGI